MSDVERIIALIGLARRYDDRVAAAERELEESKEAYRRVVQDELPDLMRELGVESLKLEDGVTISIKEDVSASITEERRGPAHAWLRDHGFGGLIKTNVTATFSRGMEEEAARLASQIALDMHVPVDCVERVHPATLKSFIRERMEAGDKLPMELFGIHPYSQAVFKEAPRKRK